MAAAGDVNGDGLADVALGAAGAPLANGKAYGSGTVFMVFGARTPGQVILRPGEPFDGYEIPHPGAATTGFGAAVARLGRRPRHRRPRRRVRAPAGARQGVDRAAARRASDGRADGAGPRRADRAPGRDARRVAGDARNDVLAVGRGRHSIPGPVPAFLFSAAGRRLACSRACATASTRAARPPARATSAPTGGPT